MKDILDALFVDLLSNGWHSFFLEQWILIGGQVSRSFPKVIYLWQYSCFGVELCVLYFHNNKDCHLHANDPLTVVARFSFRSDVRLSKKWLEENDIKIDILDGHFKGDWTEYFPIILPPYLS